MFKVIIAGGRDFNDFEKLTKFCDKVLVNKRPNVEIVSGKAKGADTLGESYANIRGFNVKEFPAQWDNKEVPYSEIGSTNGRTYWRLAGIRRNEDMADYADALIAFWDGESRGTGHMIKDARKKGLLVRVCKIK